jgi:hypothetical protein
VIVIAIVLGALYVLSVLLRRWQVKRSARKVLDTMEQAYGQPHEYRRVDPSEFPWADQEFYDQSRAFLEARGFRFIADLEDVTLSKQFRSMRTYVRVLLSENGTVSAAVYDIKPRGVMAVLRWVGLFPKDARTLDLETALTDGTFVTTSNVYGVDTTPDVPGIYSWKYPRETPWDDLLETHRRAVDYHLTVQPDVAPIRMNGYEDLLDMQHRMNEIRTKYREGVGYIQKSELYRYGADLDTINTIGDEIERVKSERGRSRDP